MSEGIETTHIGVPEPFLKLLLSYFADGIGEGEKLAEVLLKNLAEHPETVLLPEEVDKFAQWALDSKNQKLARMIGTFLRTSKAGPHGGLTFQERMLAVARKLP